MLYSFRIKVILTVYFVIILSCTDSVNKESSSFDMKAYLSKAYDLQEYNENSIRSDLAIEHFEELSQSKVMSSLDSLKYGLSLLQMGNNLTAVTIFKALLYNESSTIYKYAEKKDIMHCIGLAYFREGELQNCQENHSKYSCILPLNELAFHKNQFGSRKSIQEYNKILDLDPEDPTALWMLNLAHMTLGNYPDSVNAKRRIDFNKFESEVILKNKFVDIAGEVGVDRSGHYGGVIVEDFNQDGLLDIFCTSSYLNQEVALYIRNDQGEFVDLTDDWGLAGIVGGENALQADYNNDGFTDIYVTRGAWQITEGEIPNSLLRNNGDGSFTDVTFESGLLNFSPCHSAVFADFNNDGWLDLFVGNESGNYEQVNDPKHESKIYGDNLYMNQKDGTFKDFCAESGIRVNHWVKGVTSIDFDNDGWRDIYISCYNHENYLYKNLGVINGQVKFLDVTESSQTVGPRFSFPVACLDINNDGWEDLFVSGYFTNKNDLAIEYCQDTLPLYSSITYINNQDGTFSKWYPPSSPAQSIHAMALNYGDFDNDGWLDIYCATGSGSLQALYPNVLLKNNKGKSWNDVTMASGLGHLQKGHGIGFADFDFDGDLDIYMNIGGIYMADHYRNALFKNESKNNHNWLSLEFIGTGSNRSSIGSRIQLDYFENGILKTQYRTVSSGGSYGSSPLMQHFGLGQCDSIRQLKIIWPRGGTFKLQNLRKDNHYRIFEGSEKPLLIDREKLMFKKNKATSKHQHNH